VIVKPIDTRNFANQIASYLGQKAGRE
jgi:hypothetical protein